MVIWSVFLRTLDWCGRYGHTVVAYENDIYLFGGRNDQGACNKLYKFSTSEFVYNNQP